MSVSNSRRTPWATPAASFIRRATSSKNRLVVWVITASRTYSRRQWGFGVRPARPRKPARKAAQAGPQGRASRPARPRRPAGALTVPRPGGITGTDLRAPNAVTRHPVSEHRSGTDPDRAVRPALVRARLHHGHPARLDVRAGDHPDGAVLGRAGADDGRRLR